MRHGFQGTPRLFFAADEVGLIWFAVEEDLGVKFFSNTTEWAVDDIKSFLRDGGRLIILLMTFSSYAFRSLRDALSLIDELNFVFSTSILVCETLHYGIGEVVEFKIAGDWTA